MTKPNNFILNSDYLSIAHISTAQISVSFPAVTLPTYGQQTQTIEYPITSESGSIINSLIRINGGQWNVGNTYRFERLSGQGSSYVRWLYLSRASNNKLVFKSICQNFATGYSVTLPSVSADFKITFFKPPNLT